MDPGKCHGSNMLNKKSVNVATGFHPCSRRDSLTCRIDSFNLNFRHSEHLVKTLISMDI